MSKDHIAFRELYERYANDVFRFACSLCGDTDNAKDITAETFARCWTSSTETRMETVKAYLFAIARNVYLQQARHRRTVSTMENEPVDTSAKTDRSLEGRSELEHTLSVLRRLPELERSILLMRAYDGLSYADIAARPDSLSPPSR